jgi:hypothetical protein
LAKLIIPKMFLNLRIHAMNTTEDPYVCAGRCRPEGLINKVKSEFLVPFEKCDLATNAQKQKE